MSQPISFSDFLKEGSLKEAKKPDVKEVERAAKPFSMVGAQPTSEEQLRKFWKGLRHFFRTGTDANVRPGAFVPALIAPYLQNGNWDMGYPYYYSSTERISLEALLQEHLDACFKPEEAKILRQNVIRWMAYARDILEENDAFTDFPSLKDSVTQKLKDLEVRGKIGEQYREDLKRWTATLPDTGYVTDFDHQVTFRFLKRKLVHIDLNREIFREKIRKTHDALSEWLKSQDAKREDHQGDAGMDFTKEMISFEKVKAIKPKQGSQVMATEARERIEKILQRLEDELGPKETVPQLFVQHSLKQDFAWETMFDDCNVVFSEVSDAIAHAEKVFDQNITAFTKALIAMRQAELELEGKYNPSIHDDYFDHFKWFKLDAEELELFPPVIVVADTDHLLEVGMGELSKLLSRDKPIKVISLTSRTMMPVDPEVDWEDASHAYRQELAAFSISHRGAHTLQCASDRPTTLMDGIYAAIDSSSPALMHLLLPEPKDDSRIAFLKINAAAAGRHFPFLSYDCRRGSQWGSRFDISHNSQPEKNWPEYPFECLNVDGQETTLNLAFTYADYKAMSQEKVQELSIVPETFVTENLIPVAEYLSLSQDDSTGKVPFIWLINEENELVRAALPYMWLVSALERLDYWNFIQSVGGVNSYHVNQALIQARAVWDQEKEKEIEALSDMHAAELKRANDGAAAKAMEQLADVLLDTNGLDTASFKRSEPAPAKEKEGEKEPDEAESQTKEKEDTIASEPEPIQEAYIDSFKCTSCNDCIDKFPMIFEYNEDKQATIKDATKGSFEDLVDAAEACPAACIHPGAPLNKEEANLDALIARAAKFNA